MPKFTIIQQPLVGENPHKDSRTRQLDQPYYLERLREVLQNGRRKNQISTQYKINKNRSSSQRVIQLKPRYHTQKSDNQQSQVVYVIKQNQNQDRQRVHLPKLRRRQRNIKYSDIDQNERLIIKNYMNAKLIEFKRPKRKPMGKNKKRNSTIDQVCELPQNNSKRYYVYRKTTPIQDLSIYSNNNSRHKKSFTSSKTQKITEPTLKHYVSYPIQNVEKAPSERIILERVNKTQGNQIPIIYKPKSRTKSRIIEYTIPDEKINQSQQYRFSSGKAQQDSWQLIDPLDLQTYFIKLKKIGSHFSPEASKLDKTKIKIPKIPERQQMSRFIKGYKPQFQQVKIQQLIKKDSFQIIHDQIEGSKYFYFGETKNDTKNGVGVIITDKSLFQGIWENDAKVRGMQITEVGKYKGQFKENKRSGKGQFFWCHGQYYSGQWKNNKKHGSGYWRSLKGESYMGQWKDGQVTGFGVHTMKTGQKYEGQFINFLKHGFGRQIFPNGDVYQGRYVQGQPQGKGKYQWKNGTLYQGQFIEGFRQGKGLLIAPNRLEFQGLFKKQLISGIGKLTMANGDCFNGMFQNNKKNGHGILDLKSQKRIIKGIWNNNYLINQQY